MLSKMTKEELEQLSYAKIAEMYLKENKTKMNTADLFKEVCKLSDNEYQERIGDFFETLTTSKEFILLGDGNWDLRSNHSIKIDIDDIYEDSDTEEEITEVEEEVPEEDNYEDDYTDESDGDVIDDDYSDLTIMDDTELEEEN